MLFCEPHKKLAEFIQTLVQRNGTAHKKTYAFNENLLWPNKHSKQ